MPIHDVAAPTLSSLGSNTSNPIFIKSHASTYCSDMIAGLKDDLRVLRLAVMYIRGRFRAQGSTVKKDGATLARCPTCSSVA